MIYLLTGTSDYDIRLVEGTTAYSGRLEIFYHGIWGGVSNDSFDLTEASVVCRQLGFGNATQMKGFGSGNTSKHQGL